MFCFWCKLCKRPQSCKVRGARHVGNRSFFWHEALRLGLGRHHGYGGKRGFAVVSRAERRQAVLRFTLLACWLLGVIAVVLAGFGNDPYLEHVIGVVGHQPYDTRTLFWLVTFMTVHVVLVSATLRPVTYCHSWGRALVALTLSLGFLLFGFGASVHAPPAWIVYVFWLLTFCVLLLGLLVWSVVGSLRARWHTASSVDSNHARSGTQ